MSFLLKVLFRVFHIGMYIGAIIVPFPIPRVIKGPGSVAQLGREIKAYGVHHVLIVTGKNVSKTASFTKMTRALAQEGIRYTVFTHLQPNPTIENVESARQAYLDAGCDGIVAFGGGSPMDCAKVAAARVVRNISVRKMAGLFRILVKTPPLFAVPTTAGTGSEVTIVAVITDPERQMKFSVIDPRLVPQIAVLDPEVMAGLPASITGATGMDALTHAIEAYIGVSGNARTDQYAERAVELIFNNLERVCQNGNDLEAREQMALASHYAGIAFTKASVGYVHAISHKLGGMYQVPHGLANAIVLPYVLAAYGTKAHKKLARLAVIVGLGSALESDASLATRLIEKLKAMNAAMGIPTYVEALQPCDIPAIAASAAREANPMYSVPDILFQPQLAELIAQLVKPASTESVNQQVRQSAAQAQCDLMQ